MRLSILILLLTLTAACFVVSHSVTVCAGARSDIAISVVDSKCGVGPLDFSSLVGWTWTVPAPSDRFAAYNVAPCGIISVGLCNNASVCYAYHVPGSGKPELETDLGDWVSPVWNQTSTGASYTINGPTTCTLQDPPIQYVSTIEFICSSRQDRNFEVFPNGCATLFTMNTPLACAPQQYGQHEHEDIEQVSLF